MHAIRKTIALSLAATVLSGGMILAQDNRGHDQHADAQHDNHADAQHDNHGYAQHDNHGYAHHDNHGYVHHNEWRRGARMNRQDWSRGEQIDYRTHHLNRPPRGYQWREVDGNYVMAAIATGVIASVIAASAAH